MDTMHTPTPWKAVYFDNVGNECGRDDEGAALSHVQDAEGDALITFEDGASVTDVAMAEKMIAAVNAHDDLVKALESAKRGFESIIPYAPDDVKHVARCEIKSIDAALSSKGA